MCQLKKRISEHKGHIRRKTGNNLATHFELANHSDTDLTFWAIEKVEGGDLDRKLKNAEGRWINELHSTELGLNVNKA